MTITEKQIQTATTINDKVLKIVSELKTEQAIDEAILMLFSEYTDEVFEFISTLKSDELDTLTSKYSGFYRFFKMVEQIAEGCRDGIFDDILDETA